MYVWRLDEGVGVFIDPLANWPFGVGTSQHASQNNLR